MIKAKSIGKAWLNACSYILSNGELVKDEDKMLKEVAHLEIKVSAPEAGDPVLKKYGNKKMLDWMLSNFLEKRLVPELKNSLSYGCRLFDYNGKDQIAWAVEKLKKKPENKSTTITMLMPGSDGGYIPCISTMDFKIRNKKLVLTAFCRSLDFGKKAYANMVALHEIQGIIAKKVGVETGALVLYVVSAHVYTEDSFIQKILDEVKDGRKN